VIANVIGVLFDGLAYGSLLFLIGIGLSVTLGLMNFVNLAHGAFAMWGGYVCVALMSRLGVPFLASLPLAIFGGASISGFAWVMLFGIVVGTSSSIFIAAPILLFLGEKRLRRDTVAVEAPEPGAAPRP